MVVFCSRGCTRCNLCFHVENCQHADQKQPHATIDLRSRHRINPRPTHFVPGKANERRRRPRRYQVHLWSRGREFARGVLRSSSKAEKNYIFCHWRGMEKFSRLFSTPQRPNVLYQTPGRHPPHITDRIVNTVTRGWVVAPNERAPCGFHNAVVGFVDLCLSRTRNLAVEPLAEFF